MKHTLIQAML